MSSDDTVREALRLDHLSKLHSLALPTLAGLQTKHLVQLLEQHLDPSNDSRSSRSPRQRTRTGLWADQAGSSQHASASSSHSVTATGREHRRRRAHPGARLSALLPKWNAMHNARCRTCGIVLVPGINATIRFSDDVLLTAPTNPDSSSMNTRREKRTTICENCGACQREQKGRKSAPGAESAIEDRGVASEASAPRAANTSVMAKESPAAKDRLGKPSAGSPHPAAAAAPAIESVKPSPAKPDRPLTLDERIAKAKAERKRLKREEREGDPKAGPTDAPPPASPHQETASREDSDLAHRTHHEATRAAEQQQPETEAGGLKRPLTLDERAALAKAERKRRKKERAATSSSFDGGKAGLRALLDAEKNRR